jgi:hypothetical protein
MWIMLCMKSDDRQQISRRFVVLTLMPKHLDVGAVAHDRAVLPLLTLRPREGRKGPHVLEVTRHSLVGDIGRPAICLSIYALIMTFRYVYEGMSMEAAMARATKTKRATVGSRRGAAVVVISVTIKPDLLNWLDAWCASRLPPATRSAAIAAAVERLLAEVK